MPNVGGATVVCIARPHHCMAVQGMNIIKAKSDEMGWEVDLAGLARIWKGGCIIRAGFLDRIKNAYLENPKLDSLLVSEGFAKDLVRPCSPSRDSVIPQSCPRTGLLYASHCVVSTRTSPCPAGVASARKHL